MRKNLIRKDHKLTEFYSSEEYVPIESTAFLKEVQLSGILEIISLPEKIGRYPSIAHLSLTIFKYINQFSFYKTIEVISKDRDLLINLGYDPEYPPNVDALIYFMNDILTQEGKKELFALVDEFRYENNFFITNTTLRQPLKKDNKFAFTTKAKRRLVKDIVDYINKNIHIDLKKNTTYNTNTIFEAVTQFISETSTANGFSETFRDDPIGGIRKRQRAPTGRTLLNRLKQMFKTREEVEKFFDSLFGKMIDLVKQEAPDLFNHKQFDLAFDYNMIPAFDNQKLYSLKQAHPEKYKRNIYTNPSDLINDASIQGKGTISFRKFLCCSIVIKGFRFCVCYLPVNMLKNRGQWKLVNQMIDKIKSHIPASQIGKIYFDRGFDNEDLFRLLRQRGINYVMAKVRRVGGLKKRISEVKEDIEIFPFKLSRNEKINIIVAKSTIKNKHLFRDDKDRYDEKFQKKFAFATNIRVNKHSALELLKGYRSRWSIETMFKDKNKIYGKTTSNDNVLRDFYYSYTMTVFNMWLLCNIILCYCWLKKEPAEPKIRLRTFKNYMQIKKFYPAPT